MLPLALDDPLHQGWDVHASVALPRHEELSRDVFRELRIDINYKEIMKKLYRNYKEHYKETIKNI